MEPWEYVYARSKWATQSTLEPESVFTGEQCAKLTQVRTRFQGHPQYVELALDERRLGFARWLVEHGQIGEEM